MRSKHDSGRIVPTARKETLTRLFVIIGGLISLVLITALVAPYFINWTDYRVQFEREATRILGQPVRVAGGATARLIPFPSVTFEDVRVGDPETPLVSADRFSLDAELSPFLRGEILIFDMRLENPRISLRLNDTGLPIWPLMTEGPVDPARVVLESARIVNGSVTIADDATGRSWSLSEVDAAVSAQSLYGPFRFEGDTRLNGNPVNFRVSTGTVSKEGFPLRTVLDLPKQGIELTMDGRIAEPDGQRAEPYGGTFTISSRHEDKFVRYLVEGEYSASPRAVLVPDYRAEFGRQEDPYVVTGRGQIEGGRAPRYAVEVRGTQLTLADEKKPQAGKPGETPSAATRLAALQKVLDSIPFPPIPGSIDVDLPAIISGDTAIRDIKLLATPGDSAAGGRNWNLKRLSAQLPGRTTVEADGMLRLPGAGASDNGGAFEGNILIASRQPSGLATWLTGSADDSIRRLENAGVAARVALRPERQEIEELEVIAGPARLYGSIVRISDPTRRNTLDVALTGDGIHVQTLEALSAVFVGEGGTRRFSDHDLDIALQLTNPDIAGLVPEKLDLSLRSRADRVEIDRLSVSGLFGAAVSATASLSPHNGKNRGGFDATVVAPEGSDFLAGLSKRFPKFPLLDDLADIAVKAPKAFSDTRFDVVGTAMLTEDLGGEASLSVSGESANTSISLTATMTGDASNAEKADVLVNAAFENHAAETMLAQAGFSGLSTDGLGPLSVRLTADGSLFDGMNSTLFLEGDDMFTTLKGTWTSDILSTGFTGTGSLAARDVEPWISALGYWLPGTGLGTTADISATISYRSGKAVLNGIDAILDGNRVAGDLTVSAAEGIPVIRGDLTLDYLHGGRLYAIVTGDPSGGTQLVDPEPDATARRFDDAILAANDIDIGLKAGEVTLPAGDLPLTAFEGAFSYKGGVMSIRPFAGDFAGGRLAGSLDLQNNGGELLVNGQISAKGIAADAVLPALNGVAEASADLQLQLTGSGRSTETLISAMTGSGVLSTGATAVSNLRSDGFAPMIRLADAIGYEITAEQIERLAEQAFLQGRTTLEPAQYPVTLAGGALRIANATAQVGQMTATANAEIDLMDGEIAGTATLAYDAGEEAVAGPQPEIALTFRSSTNRGFEVGRDFAAVTGYLTQRALEREQARVEALQARLLEKQRLRREVQYFRYLKRVRLQSLEEARLRQMAAERAARQAEEARRRAEVEAEAERRRHEENAEAGQPDAPEEAPREAPQPRIQLEKLRDVLSQPIARRPLGPIDETILDNPFGPLPGSRARDAGFNLGQ